MADEPNSIPKQPSQEAQASNNGQNQDTRESLELRQEQRRSNVRVFVTYGVALTYCIGALGLILWLLLEQKYDLAISIFSGLSGVASAVIGYWFGSRQRTQK